MLKQGKMALIALGLTLMLVGCSQGGGMQLIPRRVQVQRLQQLIQTPLWIRLPRSRLKFHSITR